MSLKPKHPPAVPSKPILFPKPTIKKLASVSNSAQKEPKENVQSEPNESLSSEKPPAHTQQEEKSLTSVKYESTQEDLSQNKNAEFIANNTLPCTKISAGKESIPEIFVDTITKDAGETDCAIQKTADPVVDSLSKDNQFSTKLVLPPKDIHPPLQQAQQHNFSNNNSEDTCTRTKTAGKPPVLNPKPNIKPRLPTANHDSLLTPPGSPKPAPRKKSWQAKRKSNPESCRECQSQEKINTQTEATRQNSMLISSNKQKSIVRRPSEPPPKPPNLTPKKLTPTRPPPPVPKNRQPSLISVASSSTNSVTSITSVIEIQSSHSEDDTGIYECIDSEDDFPIPNENKVPSVEPSCNSIQIPAISCSPVAGNIEEEPEYMTPDGEVPDWPATEAPGVPKLHAETSQKSSKSGTLTSLNGPIYEDVDISSCSEDGRSSDGNPDPYSNNLDETFAKQSSDGASSSESEAEEADNSDSAKLDKKKQKVYNIAKEIMTTEENFLDNLVLINIDFRKHISNACEETGESIIPASCMNDILKHLPQLSFVNEELLKDLQQRVKHWHENPRIADVFVKKGAFLKMYTTYIKDYTTMMEDLEKAIKEYPRFAEKLREFEHSERCKNLQLRHYMLKPIQRIPQYRLLLLEYQKNLPEDSPDKADVQIALHIVSEVADDANEAMKLDENLHNLIELQNNLIGSFKVIAPSRVLLRKGLVYKQSRKELQPRTIFLFNDYLIITIPLAGGNFKVKYELPVIDMQVEQPMREDLQKNFNVVTKKKSFAAVAFTTKERDDWVNALRKAIEDEESKRSTFSTRQIPDVPNKEFILGETAPVWIPDERVTMCVLCNNDFTTLKRRHHCRACGKVVCGICSDYKTPLKYKDNKPQRVCYSCFEKLDQDAEGKLKARDAVPVRPTKAKVLLEVTANTEGDIGGALYTYNTKKKHWEKNWFVLKDNVLYKFSASDDCAAKETKPLPGYKIDSLGHNFDGFDNSLMFKLNHPSKSIESIIFRAETPKNAAEWASKMKESTLPELNASGVMRTLETSLTDS